MKQIHKRIINCLSCVKLKEFDAIHAIVGGKKPENLSKWDHEAITSAALFTLINEGLVVSGNTTAHTYRRATEEEVEAFHKNLYGCEIRLRKAMNFNFKYRNTLMKAAEIKLERDFDRAMSILKKDGIIAEESCRGKMGNKYRILRGEEQTAREGIKLEKLQQERANANRWARKDEEIRWRKAAVRDALEIGWERFKKFRGNSKITFNFETEKWEYTFMGEVFSFAVEIGRKLSLDFGDIEVEVTNLYNFTSILRKVRNYRFAVAELGSVCTIVQRGRSMFLRRNAEEKGDATFTLKMTKRNAYDASGWTWSEREVA